MTQPRPVPAFGIAAGLACLLAFGASRPRALEADANTPAYTVRLTPEATPDANPNDDVDQQPAVLAQWNSSGPTGKSLGRVVERLERDHDGRVVEQKGTRYPSGAWATRETLVRSNLPGRALVSDVKRTWSPSGMQTLLFRQSDVLNAAGNQVSGERQTLHYQRGLPTLEIAEHWDPSFGGWLQTYRRTTAYYGDGSPRRRVTERPALNRKTEEDWGAVGARGLREKTDFLWDGTARRIVPRVEAAP